MVLDKVILSRDVHAMLIPSGLDVVLAKGNEVRITHHLGGNYTVVGTFGMARIDAWDADVLGLERQPKPGAGEDSQQNGSSKPKREYAFEKSAVNEDDLWAAAKTVFDPEIPVNIVDLGLVYRLETDENGKVEVDMTLTAPGCSMGPMIADDLRVRLEAVSGVREAVVNIVWDPPWNQDMMSEEARMILGLA